MMINAKIVKVRGLVQGVGFRPFVYKLALRLKLKGWVENRNDGVLIKIEGEEEALALFPVLLRKEASPVSNITSLKLEESEIENFIDFRIIKSENISEEITEISPDIAVCPDCLKDMQEQKNRIDYPFINCTHCGPRFSIIEDLPYDREKTTMKPFRMCRDCEREYVDIMDRRFHAQPVACSVCGPEYELLHDGRKIRGTEEIVKIVSELLLDGKIVAIKGLGGFFLSCDATNQKAVKQLRTRKNREGKPFAVMFSDIDRLENYVEINEVEKDSLQSWRRPIVLLKQKRELAKDVNMGFDTIGAMLPYMPFHFLLFEKLDLPAIVLTSGNCSEEPIEIENDEAESNLSGIYDSLLIYNRKIYNRVDDSVVTCINNIERVIRRSRGYAPSPVNLSMNTEGILATGAELVNCFCVGKGNQAILSQHIGDLKNMETYDFYTSSINQFRKLFRLEPSLIACDMHPEYLSSKYAEETGIPLVKIQHHHAHIASCMAEHNIDEKVIGVSFDGTGLGDDFNIWGGEFLIADFLDYKRHTHFEYIPMIGGDKAATEPWRMGVSYLYMTFGEEVYDLDIPFIRQMKKSDIQLLTTVIDKKINTPLTSSAGRLFDAIAAITGLCTSTEFHAEAPMRLEARIQKDCEGKYSFDYGERISFTKSIRQIVDDITSGIPISVISAKFHNTIVDLILTVVRDMRSSNSINKVVLSGGTFQNKYLLKKTEDILINDNFEVFTQRTIPTNDGGIALGQMAIAAKRRELKCV